MINELFSQVDVKKEARLIIWLVTNLAKFHLLNGIALMVYVFAYCTSHGFAAGKAVRTGLFRFIEELHSRRTLILPLNIFLCLYDHGLFEFRNCFLCCLLQYLLKMPRDANHFILNYLLVILIFINYI